MDRLICIIKMYDLKTIMMKKKIFFSFVSELKREKIREREEREREEREVGVVRERFSLFFLSVSRFQGFDSLSKKARERERERKECTNVFSLLVLSSSSLSFFSLLSKTTKRKNTNSNSHLFKSIYIERIFLYT